MCKRDVARTKGSEVESSDLQSNARSPSVAVTEHAKDECSKRSEEQSERDCKGHRTQTAVKVWCESGRTECDREETATQISDVLQSIPMKPTRWHRKPKPKSISTSTSLVDPTYKPSREEEREL